MWVDEDGVAHLVALPKPQQLMTKSFRRALDGLREMHPTELDEMLTGVEDALFSDDLLPPDEPQVLAQYEGCAAPRKILRGAPATPNQLQRTLDNVEARWKLDVVLALQDYLDD